ncbi:hypothetical protein [Chitinimonas lacunae]|uniref:XRE family transcriptional regulator n=1 Tax=Chitinimonas lacunae TaxID=1963018 RepID=A0ABV8MY93_9NEIS
MVQNSFMRINIETEPDLDTLRGRLVAALRYTGSTKVDLGAATGTAPSSVHIWVTKDDAEIGVQRAIRAADFLGVNVRWLALGEGPIFPCREGGASSDKATTINLGTISPLHAEAQRLGASAEVLSQLTNAEVAQLLAVLTKGEERTKEGAKE